MARKDYTALLESNVWDKVQKRLLAGVRNASQRDQLSVVLENTRKSLLADTTLQNVSYIPKLVLPLVRRVFPKLIANNIISTQALQGPSGIIRYLDAYIEDVNGNRIDRDSPFGQGNIYPWNSDDVNYSQAPTLVQSWLFNSGATKDEPVETPIDVNTAVPATVATYTDTDTVPATSGKLALKYSEGTLYLMAARVESGKINAQGAVRVATIDRNGVIQQLNQGVDKVYGVIDVKTGDYAFTLVPSTKESGKTYVYFWEYKKDIQKNILFGGTDTAREGKDINTMQFDIKKITVDTKSRKLGAKYSFELMEDYQNEFGEKFEDRMVDYLTTTILTEIDKEVIQMLSDKAVWHASWDARQPVVWTRGINAWYETILPKINALSNTIYERTSVGGATFLVCNPVTATIFQSLNCWTAKGNPVDGDMQVGSTSAGSLGGGFDVYVSPMCKKGEILLGFKGKSPEETGAIYAPYVPIQLQPITYNEGMQAVLARSRYWMGVLRPDYYAKLSVEGLFEDISGDQYTVAY